MNVAFLCSSSLENPAPRRRYLPLAREMVRLGVQVRLLMLHPTFDQISQHAMVVDGVATHYVGQMHVYGYPGARRYFRPLTLLRTSFQGAVRLAAQAWRSGAEIVHVGKPQPINGLAGLLLRQLGRRLYVDCDDYEAQANRFKGSWQRWGVQWWEDHLPRWAEGVTVNTRFLYERFKVMGIPTRRLFYLPNGADPTVRFPTQEVLAGLRRSLRLEDKQVIVYIGALNLISHGVGLLLDAFAILLQRLPRAHLLVIGEGDDRAMLERQARRLGIDRAISFIGYVPPVAVGAWYQLGLCSVDPVYDDAVARARSPLKLVESLAAGTPVVTGDVGDRGEMLGHGTAGLLVQAGDALALASALERLCTDTVLRRDLRAGAREQSRRYQWDVLVHTCLNAYQSDSLEKPISL